MESSFAMADSTFDFLRSQPFSEQEIAEALQKGLENSPTLPFTMTDTAGFDFASLFGDVPNDVATVKNEEDQPMPSIEASETPNNVLGTTQGKISPENDVSNPAVTVESVQKNHMPPASPSKELQVFSGLKDESNDPLLYSMEFDDLFTGNNTSFDGFDGNLKAPTNDLSHLTSPFQLPNQRADGIVDMLIHMPKQGIFPHNGVHDPSRLAPHQFPNGRRRSNTAPPEFEPGIAFRQHANGNSIQIGRPMPSHLPLESRQSFPTHPIHNNMQGRRFDPRYHPDANGTMPRSYPITPPRHLNSHAMLVPHDNYMPSRPQSLAPEMRVSLSDRMRDCSPDRGRKIKRQKQSHDRRGAAPTAQMQLLQQQENAIDFAMWGMDQTLSVVECLLRDAVDRVKYGRDEEIEKARTESRTSNAKVTSMDGELTAMASQDAPPIQLPKCGNEIKLLNTQHIHALLNFYDIPFISTMFLHDKKLLYLRFLGASGTLKHLVLD